MNKKNDRLGINEEKSVCKAAKTISFLGFRKIFDRSVLTRKLKCNMHILAVQVLKLAVWH